MIPLLLLAATLGAPRVGIFVGSNAPGPNREGLKHAEADAERVRDAFVELGGVSAASAHVLRSPDAAQVLAMLEHLPRGPELLVLYYSGHADEQGLLLGQTRLDFRELNEAVDVMRPELGLQIVDACRSGAQTRRKGVRLGRRIQVHGETGAEGRVHISSSAAWEDALESDRLGGSFFTLHWVTGLRGSADADGDGEVGLEEAYRYAYARTVESTLASGAGVQHPSFRYDLAGQGALTLTWPERARGAMVFDDGVYAVTRVQGGRLVAEVHTAGRLAVAPGTYRIVRREREALATGNVRIGAGEEVSVDAHLTQRTTYARWVRKGGGEGRVHGLSAQVGLRGRLGPEVPTAAMWRIAYELGLPALSLGARVGLTSPAGLSTPRLELSTQEVNLGLELSRTWDWPGFGVRLGLGGELVHLRQEEAQSRIAGRSAWGGAVSLGLGLESAPIFERLLVFGTGEAVLYAYPRTDAIGVETEPAEELATRVTYRALIGLGVML